MLLAGRRLKAKILAISAHLIGLNSPEALDVVDGDVVRLIEGQWTSTGMSLAGIARTAHLDPLKLPPGMEPGLHVSFAFDPPPMTYSNATHCCEVEVVARRAAYRSSAIWWPMTAVRK